VLGAGKATPCGWANGPTLTAPVRGANATREGRDGGTVPRSNRGTGLASELRSEEIFNPRSHSEGYPVLGAPDGLVPAISRNIPIVPANPNGELVGLK
jgi:hypothetical protein